MKTKLISRIYRDIQARKQCIKTTNFEWLNKWTDHLELLNKSLPSGSGIDAGCKIDIQNSKEDKIIISFSYHHLNENGYYDGWTDHKLILRPTFDEFSMKITGKDKNQVKDYLYDVFYFALNKEIEFTAIE
jgi:hypothetical protein